MNTNHSNDSFQSVRVFCSKAKTRLFLLASLPCLISSAWAGYPIDLTMPDPLLEHIKGSLVATPDSTPFGPRVMPLTPAAKPGPTPLGPPITQPGNRHHPCVTCNGTAFRDGSRPRPQPVNGSRR